MTAAAIAHDIIRRGYKPVPVPIGKKSPGLPEWQKLDVTPDTVPRYFDGGDQNVGALMGRRSNDLSSRNPGRGKNIQAMTQNRRNPRMRIDGRGKCCLTSNSFRSMA